MSALKELLKGIVKENPVLKVLLGFCPVLAVTTSALNGISMGLATTFVLICSNAAISLLAKWIPDNVRIPCYIVVIASFVTIVDLLIQAYSPELNKSLGIFIPLIVVNCIILGRAEAFANKNGVWYSILDAIGMGVGFTLALFLLASVREILGAGTWFAGTNFSMTLCPKDIPTILIFALPPGAFATLGFMIAAVNWFEKRRKA